MHTICGWHRDSNVYVFADSSGITIKCARTNSGIDARNLSVIKAARLLLRLRNNGVKVPDRAFINLINYADTFELLGFCECPDAAREISTILERQESVI